MAGNARFESPTASSSEPGFSGTYSNGKRGTHSASVGPNLDRSGSFRENTENRMFNSGISVSRSGNNATLASGSLPPLSQCLSLEPIPMGDRKIDRSVELKRVMGLIVEENSSGVAGTTNAKPTPPVAVAEDLKRLRSSVVDTCMTARGRASKLDEHLHKLDKYCDGVTSKKPQRNESTTNDQAGGLSSKNGTQIYRNPAELVNQRVEDRPKNVLLNKRVRTSVAETRAELRSNGLRRGPVAIAKDRDLVKNGVESDILEEKIQRLPAGGEGWDKKMKRKRSVGSVFTRPMDSNGDPNPKRPVQNKVVSEPGSPSNDTHPFRLGASNGTGGNNKSETSSLPNSSRSRLSPRNEVDGPALPNKERILMKGNNKLNNNSTRDDNYTPGNSPVTKGKATRTPRNGNIGTPETWENPPGGSKIPAPGGVNRKRAMPSSSSPSMAQWVGQRPQKMSRTRRSNLVSPVSNQEEKTLSSDSCSHSDISVRPVSDGAHGGPIISKQFKPKIEPVQSPHRLSESEESVGGESRLKDKKGNNDLNAGQSLGQINGQVNGQNDGQVSGQGVSQTVSQTVGPSLGNGVKVKTVINEENGEGVRRQGRSGRGPLIARATSSVNGDKLENPATLKPIRRPGFEKNGSKSGRPLKKLTERKGFSRLGHLQNGGSEYIGKSDDDREELLAAANHARNASYLACSSPFWKKLEPIFASVSSKDRFYLSVQLKEHDVQESFPQLQGRENNVLVKHQGSESFSGRLDSEKTPKELIPLFQRVLSAIIIDDNIEELEEEIEELEVEEDTRNPPLQDTFSNSTYNNNNNNSKTFHLENYDPRKRAKMDISQSPHSVRVSFSINGCTNSFRSKDSLCEEVELYAGISKNFSNRPQVLQMDGFGISSFDNQYEKMCVDDKLLLELQSIGIYPELVPKLDDKEDEAIKHEIDQLKSKLRQQNGKKRAFLEKIRKGVERSFVGRDLEQVAIDRLVELAYRKLLATRGPSRAGIPKIPKHIALAFGRRTLAKCRKFGKSGISCFNVSPLRDILFAPQEIELDPTPPSVSGPTTKYIGFQNPQSYSRISSSDAAFAMNGPISNRGKKKELYLDDVGTIPGGPIGKRCDRKTKTKQKTGHPPTPGSGFANTRTLHPVQPSVYGPNRTLDNGVDNRRDIRMVSENNEIIDPTNIDPIDEFGGGPEDLSSLLNFDEEELQEDFSAGLEIPMDDLTELNMF